MEDKILETEWLPLSVYNNRWILGMGDLKPIKISPDFCRNNNISVWDLKEYEKKGLLFYSEEDAINKVKIMMEQIERDKIYREALEAWWDPEKYYTITKR